MKTTTTIKIIRRLEDAVAIGKKHLDDLQQYSEAQNVIITPAENNNNNGLERLASIPPLNANSPVWEMSVEALRNTLLYFIQHLHHPCYLLCVNAANQHQLYKILAQTTAHLFAKKAQADLKRITDPQQRGKIQQIIQKPFRVMQCIVKPIEPEKDETVASEEYARWLTELQLSAGIYVLNLTDAVVLTKTGVEPFSAVSGTNVALPRGVKTNKMLPVLSLSGQQGYLDIPIPTYDDIAFLHDPALLEQSRHFITEWGQKTIEKAVFRGGPSGCGYTTETNQRLALVAAAKNNQNLAAMLDVGIVSGSSAIKFDPQHGLGMMQDGLYKKAGRLTMKEQSHYKWILHIDGNVLAYRLLYSFLTGSLILRVKSPYISWADNWLKKGKHYVEVDGDLGDLERVLIWCSNHDEECRDIARNGMLMATRILNAGFMAEFMRNLFKELQVVDGTHRDAKCLPWNRTPRNTWIAKYDRKHQQQLQQPPTNTNIPAVSSATDYLKPKTVLPPPPPISQKKAITKKTKTKPTKILPINQPPPQNNQPAVLPDENAGLYLKQTEKERCRKGFETNKKNKMECVATTNKQTPAVLTRNVVENVPQNTEAEAEETAGDYMKQTDKERCRKGYETDRKNKMRCTLKKTTATTQQPTKQPTQNNPAVIMQNVVENVVEEEEYTKKTDKERCRKGYETDKKDKTKCRKTVKKTAATATKTKKTKTTKKKSKSNSSIEVSTPSFSSQN